MDKNRLAMSYAKCARCMGTGSTLSGKECPCVKREIQKEFNRCRDGWEVLDLERSLNPDYFPPFPIPSSSMGEYFYGRMTELT